MNKLLLPPNATPLEQALAELAGRATLSNVDLPITGIKLTNPPDAWLDFLIFEWGLSEFLPYFDDKRALIKSALYFNRIRGTKRAVHLALSWADLTAGIVEYQPSETMANLAQSLAKSNYKPYLHFGEFDLTIDDNFNKNQITKAVELANLAKPLRSRLTRLVGGYDRRKFVLDDSRLSDALLSDDSGVRLTQDDLAYPLAVDDLPKVSLRRTHTAEINYPTPTIETAITITYHLHIKSWQADMPYLDDLPDPVEVQMVTSGGGTLPPAIYVGQVWADQPWTDESWGQVREMVSVAYKIV